MGEVRFGLEHSGPVADFVCAFSLVWILPKNVPNEVGCQNALGARGDRVVTASLGPSFKLRWSAPYLCLGPRVRDTGPRRGEAARSQTSDSDFEPTINSGN